MQIKVDPGTEKWIKWAKLKLSKLTSLRKDIKLPSMIKFYQPAAGTLVHLKSADWENYITITGGGPGGFLVRPFIITTDVETLTGVRALIPLNLSSITTYPNSVSNVSQYPYHIQGKVLTSATFDAVQGYLTGQRKIGNSALPGLSGVFKVGGTVFRIRDDGIIAPMDDIAPLIGSTAFPRTMDGLHAISGKFISFNGGTTGPWNTDVVAVSGDLIVSSETQIDTSFGNRTDTFASNGTGGSGSSFSTSSTSSSSGSYDVTFPVAKALNSAGEVQSIIVREIFSSSSSGSTNTSYDATEDVVAETWSSSSSASASQEITITLPGASDKSYTLQSTANSSGGSGDRTAVSGVVTSSASGSYSKREDITFFTPLYADARYPMFVFRLNQTNTVFSGSGNNGDDGSGYGVTVSATGSITSRTRIIALVGDTETVLLDSTTVTPISGSVGAAGHSHAATHSSGGTTVSAFNGNPYFKANRNVASLQLANHPSDAYLGYTDSVVFAHKDTEALKLKMVNRLLLAAGPPAGLATRPGWNVVDGVYVFTPLTSADGFSWGFTEIRIV